MSITESAPLTLRPGVWRLDAAHSLVAFSIRHLGIAKVRGRFNSFDTELVVGESLASSSLTATVELASVDTGNVDRDNHVRSADLLHVERRPTMTFRSTRINGGDAAWLVDGDLTIGDITRPFSLDVEFGGLESFVDGTRHAGFEAKGELRRTEFGIDLPGGIGGAMLGDVVRVELDVELVEPSP
jgi:polyisoprenoid-binding protein YceI